MEKYENYHIKNMFRNYIQEKYEKIKITNIDIN